ncbi:MAG: hypothetical protein U0270_31050 [Labilithrix sp.]
MRPEGMMVHWRGTFGTCEHVPESPTKDVSPSLSQSKVYHLVG